MLTMARLKIPRKVMNPPIVRGFKPYGKEQGADNFESITLNFEEYEALKLCDYDMYNHSQASAIMNVSRPTFTRIYASARIKISKAFVEGRQIEIEGGKVYFDSEWFRCSSCECNFNNPHMQEKVTSCPLCGSKEVSSYPSNNEETATEDTCYCPTCGFEKRHQHGNRCNKELCPTCNKPMKRRGRQ